LQNLALKSQIGNPDSATATHSACQAWGDYSTNVIDYDYDYLLPARLRLNKITM